MTSETLITLTLEDIIALASKEAGKKLELKGIQVETKGDPDKGDFRYVLKKVVLKEKA